MNIRTYLIKKLNFEQVVKTSILSAKHYTLIYKIGFQDFNFIWKIGVCASGFLNNA